jgi:radical SAM family uncharacterized protein/radical SAM-linked protein
MFPCIGENVALLLHRPEATKTRSDGMLNNEEIRARFERILPGVIRPGRYVGGEYGSTAVDHEGRTTFVHLYPDTYEVGMPYLGGAILRHILNGRDEFAAERLFTPWPDMAAALRREGVPLVSIETRTPVRSFDALLVSFCTELTYTNFLETLDLSRIPVRSADRGPDDPIVVAGGSCAFNLEPMAPFVDAVCVGDGEEAIIEIARTIREGKNTGATRGEIVDALGGIEGVYVPSWYEAEYDGVVFRGLRPTRDDAPELVRARTVDSLKSSFYPSPPLVPSLEVAHDRLTVEIMRGCPRACRFCSAGATYRPVRSRPPDEVAREVLEGIRSTGYDETTLLSLSATDYDGIEDLVSRLASELSGSGVSVALPSLRAETVTPELLRSLSAVRSRGLTLAPEAGTERLRRIIGKRTADDAVVRAVSIALDAGWTSVKLYFMVGLPYETEEDTTGIGRLLGRINRIRKESGSRATVTGSIAPFTPRPHTPFQWARQWTREEVREAYVKARGQRRRRGINYRFRDPELAFVDGLLARGGRNLAPVIETAWRKGAMFDGWHEGFDLEPWAAAFSEHGIDTEKNLGPFDLDSPLPWDHVEKGLSDFNRKSWNNAAEIAAGQFEPEPPVAPLPEQPSVEHKRSADRDDRFGRRARVRTPRRPATPAHTTGRGRLRVRWARSGDARFASHLDTGRMWERALRRAGTPVAYTQGFHPHMRLAFGPPLSVGYESEAEYIDVFLSAPVGRVELDVLRSALPPGVSIREAKTVFSKGPSLTASLNFAEYECGVPDAPGDLPARAARLIENKDLVVVRTRKGETSSFDVRDRLHGVEVMPLSGGNAMIRCEVLFDETGFLRPTEVLVFGLGLSEEQVRAGRVVRTVLLERSATGATRDPLDAV